MSETSGKKVAPILGSSTTLGIPGVDKDGNPTPCTTLFHPYPEEIQAIFREIFEKCDGDETMARAKFAELLREAIAFERLHMDPPDVEPVIVTEADGSVKKIILR